MIPYLIDCRRHPSPRAAMDKALLDRLRAGDPAAVATILTLYRSRILAWAGRFIVDPTTRDDVLQEVAIKLIVTHADVRAENEDSFFAWLRTIVTNATTDILRKEGRRRRFIKSFGLNSGVCAGSGEQTDVRDELCNIINRCGISNNDHKLLLDYFGNGYTSGELGQKLNITAENVRARIGRLLDRIRHAIGATKSTQTANRKSSPPSCESSKMKDSI
jgi:RNA polymerase sigma factor (sigma-70 family)